LVVEQESRDNVQHRCALSFDQADVADGLVEATMQVSEAMLAQHRALAPQADASRADFELCGERSLAAFYGQLVWMLLEPT
jgi:hypothetical protein